ncbi:hypothetical protein L6452_42038 [Arctium lappa]|uniref:Uncharacterized protein n=1 Tax=Arctium lappa TaxID=4217 RepID=A0ACB8XHR3_ARCLA|nr:hypothetical protein L6452_42038 [Arctium lappa]
MPNHFQSSSGQVKSSSMRISSVEVKIVIMFVVYGNKVEGLWCNSGEVGALSIRSMKASFFDLPHSSHQICSIFALLIDQIRKKADLALSLKSVWLSISSPL